MEKMELKELKKIEDCASAISKILQKYYEIDKDIADWASLMFLETNFQKIEKPKLSVLAKIKINTKNILTFLTKKSNKYPYKSIIQKIQTIILSVLLFIISLSVIFCIGYFLYAVRPIPKYKTAVSETYKFPSSESWNNQTFSKEGISITTKDGDSFNQASRTLQEGQSIQMRTYEGMLLNVTKKNHQIWLEKVEE